MVRLILSDLQWSKLSNLLPGRKASKSRPAKNNRLFVEAVLYRYRTGIPWRDLPENPFGHWRNIHKRHMRWSRKGVWKNVFDVLNTCSDDTYAIIDGTIVRAHQHSAGYLKKKEKTTKPLDVVAEG